MHKAKHIPIFHNLINWHKNENKKRKKKALGGFLIYFYVHMNYIYREWYMEKRGISYEVMVESVTLPSSIKCIPIKHLFSIKRNDSLAHKNTWEQFLIRNIVNKSFQFLPQPIYDWFFFFRGFVLFTLKLQKISIFWGWIGSHIVILLLLEAHFSLTEWGYPLWFCNNFYFVKSIWRSDRVCENEI